ncbi:MAG: DMP19 family protein [Acetobacter sp.]|nr:DMP19 family protein [Bacteroides sp.]MCM1341528.1 DMP19 family protein [Acetobacter sp.]MCM1433684.1 DMP19 family protein [Clostridiales bacterium]
MGIFKAIFGVVKEIRQSKRKCEEYKQMTDSQLSALDDEELFDAVWNVLSYDIDEPNDVANDCQKVFYTLSYFEMEVNNGGLCQFFVNSSREWAIYVSDSLNVIKADKIKKIFDEFVMTNNIDLNNLDSFIIEDVSEFEIQNKRYDFDSFDDYFYENNEIHQLLIDYARNNIDKLILRN